MTLNEEPAGLARMLQVRAWRDAAHEGFGVDARSDYAERFWLPVLGPSALWLLRLLARRLETSANPGGPILLDPTETARALGLGDRTGPRAPFTRTLDRCVAFDMAARRGPGLLEVRTVLPLLPRRHLARLHPGLRAEHEQIDRAGVARCHDRSDDRGLASPAARDEAHPSEEPGPGCPAIDPLRTRCRQLALSLVDLGEDRGTTERQLLRWRFHPSLAREATEWALSQRAPAR